MYFGSTELRELLRSLYRDLFKYPIVKNIRTRNSATLDCDFIDEQFKCELNATKFLGIGNPSESGVHILYYFRQENSLSKKHFINVHEIFDYVVEDSPQSGHRLISTIKDEKIKRYVFIDDLCGTGTQAAFYSKSIVSNIKKINPSIELQYLMLFATEEGIDYIKKNSQFDRVDSIYILDDTFKVFSDKSRFFSSELEKYNILKTVCHQICSKHGTNLCPAHPLGYKNGQLMLSLFHNTPNNTLPIFWCESPEWKAAFKRYSKIS